MNVSRCKFLSCDVAWHLFRLGKSAIMLQAFACNCDYTNNFNILNFRKR